MITISPELLSWVDLLAKIGQFLFGLCTLALAIWATTVKRKDFFRSELNKKQLEELGKVRADLHSIFFDLHYIPITTEMMKNMAWNTDKLKEIDPESWEQIQRYKRTSLDIFYKFSGENYYLFPEWIDRKRMRQFAEAMKSFAPFTPNATTSKSQSEREAYANEILGIKDHFDVVLRAHA
ncbi:hypothetical protein MRS60_29970 [Burkholderia pyrrocinia]|uniref:hypothetical protein n=1 Tax=Burkholderia pyrrocinia TaxID=60550 RepID=UPI001FB54063|nr:hypothetical protein [Burkholderia pyrrocinia]UOB58398.1 hypothetical protein MRS60_29970 [Burkholderia pyrrocinia]